MENLRPIYRDKMFYNESVYQPDVRLGEDGVYRWSYQLDQYHSRKMYRLLFQICAFISLSGLIAGFIFARVPVDVLRQNPGKYQTLIWQYRLLYGLLGYIILFAAGALIIGLVYLMDGGSTKYWYQMNEQFVRIQPSGRGSGVNAFAEVRRAELLPGFSPSTLYWP